jgi:hypothetical protein
MTDPYPLDLYLANLPPPDGSRRFFAAHARAEAVAVALSTPYYEAPAPLPGGGALDATQLEGRRGRAVAEARRAYVAERPELGATALAVQLGMSRKGVQNIRRKIREEASEHHTL